MWLYTDQAQKSQSDISLGRKAWTHVIALLKGALICGVKTFLYVTWEKFAIQFVLVKSVFFELTSHSRTWDYRSGISPAGSEKWLGPGIYRQERLVSLRGKKWNQRLYLAKVLMNKTACVGRGNRVILVGQVVLDFHREHTWAILTGPALTCWNRTWTLSVSAKKILPRLQIDNHCFNTRSFTVFLLKLSKVRYQSLCVACVSGLYCECFQWVLSFIELVEHHWEHLAHVYSVFRLTNLGKKSVSPKGARDPVPLQNIGRERKLYIKINKCKYYKI